jgi:hypothetical protein
MRYCREAQRRLMGRPYALAQQWVLIGSVEHAGAMTAVDLDDTSRWPLGVRGESCGVERDDLAVCTVNLSRPASPA